MTNEEKTVQTSFISEVIPSPSPFLLTTGAKFKLNIKSSSPLTPSASLDPPSLAPLTSLAPLSLTPSASLAPLTSSSPLTPLTSLITSAPLISSAPLDDLNSISVKSSEKRKDKGKMIIKMHSSLPSSADPPAVPVDSKEDVAEIEEMIDLGYGYGVSLSDTHSRIPERSIAKDLNKYDIPDHIKIKAEEIYVKTGQYVFKGEQRIKHILVCLKYAYDEYNLPLSIEQIAKKIDYDGDISRCNFGMNYKKSTYERQSKFYFPQDFIPRFLSNFPIDEIHKEEVMQMADRILSLDENEDTDQLKPTVIAMGIIKYYFDMHGIAYDINIMEDLTDRKIATIESAKILVQRLDNSA